jgi:hypothetical protein
MSRVSSSHLAIIWALCSACSLPAFLGGEESSQHLPTTGDGQPLPFWDITNPPEPEVAKSTPVFPTAIRSVYFKGECAGEGKKGSSGIKLVLAGTITNPTEDTVHRAVLTGALFIKLNEDFSLLRASGGSGFVEEVSSDQPWRAGTARAFEIESRAVDPIYCEYTPELAIGALHMNLKSPLGGKVDAWVYRTPVAWAATGGMRVVRDASLAKSLRPDSPFAVERLAEGTALSLTMVARDKGLVALPGGTFGWVPMDQLHLHGESPLEEAAAVEKASASWSQGDWRYALSGLAYENPAAASMPGALRVVAGQLEIRHIGERGGRCSASKVRMLHSGGKTASAEASDGLKAACSVRVEAGGSGSGRVRFVLPPGAVPLAVGQSGGGADGVSLAKL